MQCLPLPATIVVSVRLPPYLNSCVKLKESFIVGEGMFAKEVRAAVEWLTAVFRASIVPSQGEVHLTDVVDAWRSR